MVVAGKSGWHSAVPPFVGENYEADTSAEADRTLSAQARVHPFACAPSPNFIEHLEHLCELLRARRLSA